MYSAFVPGGKHHFKVPALVIGSNAQVTWSADSTMVGMQADMERPNEVIIEALQAGNTVINVTSSDGKCGSALLEVTPATETDWEIGNARYNNGQSLHLNSGVPTVDGSPLEENGMAPACNNCHGITATQGAFINVSHTPEQTGGFSNQDLVNLITKGDFPEGGYFDTKIVKYAAWHAFHQWSDITKDQQLGIIVYLRSLLPADQDGAVNFGAFDIDAGSEEVDDAEAEGGQADAESTTTQDATTVVDSSSPDGGSDARSGDAGDATTD